MSEKSNMASGFMGCSLALLAIVIIIGGILVVRSVQTMNDYPNPEPQTSQQPISPKPPTPPPPPPEIVPVSDEAKTPRGATVVRIIDGDTLIVLFDDDSKERVRLRRENAPEMNEPGGEEAKAELEKRFPPGSRVSVTVYAHDKYARAVAEVEKAPALEDGVSSNSADADQSKRKDFIAKLVRQGIFNKVEYKSTEAIVWIGDTFYQLDFDTKQEFCAVVYAYLSTYMKDPLVSVTLKDIQSGKTVGDYGQQWDGFGLKMK